MLLISDTDSPVAFSIVAAIDIKKKFLKIWKKLMSMVAAADSFDHKLSMLFLLQDMFEK